jgi:hypothetical protein
MERLPVVEGGAQKFDVERFSLQKLSVLEVQKKYEIKISKQVCNFGEHK